MSALEDRRQAAREAGLDEVGVRVVLDTVNAVEAAIEAATRVRITPEIINAATRVAADTWSMSEIIRAALEAAGFEVEE